MKEFKTTVKASLILKHKINKKLFQEANINELLKLMNMISVFNLQHFITTSTWIRFHRLIDAAQDGKLKLNIYKDRK